MAELLQVDENKLLIQLQGGSILAFKMVFERFYTQLCILANRYVNDKEANKDIVNEVFIKLWNGPKQFLNLDHVLANLYLATKHTALNHQQAVIRSMQRNFVCSHVK